MSQIAQGMHKEKPDGRVYFVNFKGEKDSNITVKQFVKH